MVYQRDPTSSVESVLGAGVAPLTSLEFGTDSGFQNTSEFLAATIGVLACLRLEVEEGAVAIELRGDSKTALHWANKLRFNSKAVNKAAILFTLLLVRQKVVITGTEHVPAEFNGQCDALSRWNKNGEFRRVSEFLSGVRDLEVGKD